MDDKYWPIWTYFLTRNPDIPLPWSAVPVLVPPGNTCDPVTPGPAGDTLAIDSGVNHTPASLCEDSCIIGCIAPPRLMFARKEKVNQGGVKY